MGGKVTLRGRNFLGFEIEATGENIEEIKQELDVILSSSQHLLQNTITTLKLSESNKEYADEIVRMLKKRGVDIHALLVENKASLDTDIPLIETKNINLLKEQEEKRTATYRGNLRSGQVIRVNGDLVVVGNVNANSYIYATGSIFVLGKLHGIPHAGYGGDNSAIIFAFEMNPPQIRIGDLITRSPEDTYPEKTKGGDMEVAYVNKGNIMISPYKEWLNIMVMEGR